VTASLQPRAAADLLHEARTRERAACIPEAIACYEAAITTAERAGERVVLAEALRRLAVVRHHRNESAVARALCDRSFAVAREVGNDLLAAEALNTLGGLDLAGLEINGGMSMIQVELPAPSGVVPIRISGGASQITVQRPAGVPARVHLKGWVSEFIFDEQTFSAVGNDVRLQSPGYDTADRRYDIEVSSSASMVTIIAR